MANEPKALKGGIVQNHIVLWLTSILTGLFLLQYVYWMVKEETVWLPETASLIKFTLLIVGLIYLIPGLKGFWRLALQFIVIVVSNAIFMDYQFVPLAKWKWSAVAAFMYDNGIQLSPFIWFSLGTWIVYVLAVWLLSRRIPMYIVFIVSIVAFCIRDSFSNLSLWKEVAVLLFCGVMMMVVVHLLRVQKEAPAAWTRLARRPFPILLPVLLLAIIFLSIVRFTPHIRPVLTDPYTAWKHYQGEEVKRFFSEDGFFVDLGSQGEAASGYSRDDSQLGGGFHFNYSEVMKVRSSYRSYWRGESRSVYTGKGWERGEDEKMEALERVLPEQPMTSDPKVDRSKAELKDIEFTVRMVSEDIYPVLFGAYSMHSLIDTGEEEFNTDEIAWSSQDSVLHFLGQNGYPAEFTIRSKIPVVDLEGLRSIRFEDIDKEQWKDYLQIPDSMPARVEELAQTITAEAGNPYDKVKSIERYLAETYKYNTTPDVGDSDDFVDQFLFEVKEGYCDYFSTAMVMMSRSIGMPARWVKGFAAGRSMMDEMIDSGGPYARYQQVTGSADEYTVRNADAHSWVEVYFPGWGWIPFEPTAGFSLPVIYQTNNQPAQESVDRPDQTGPVEDEIDVQASWLRWVFGAVFSLAAAAALWIIIRFVPWSSARKWLKHRRYAGNYNKMVLNDVHRFNRYSKRKGYVRYDHETMRQTYERWIKDSIWLDRDLNRLLQVFEQANYSGAELTHQAVEETRGAIIRLKNKMK